MAIKRKLVETKDGTKHFVYETSFDKGVGAAPNPKVEAVIRGQDKKTWQEERKRRSNTSTRKKK